MKVRLITFVGLVLIPFAGRAELARVQWDDKRTVAREFIVQPAKFAEWCAKLRRGEKVQWRFEAAGPLDFNVHYHEGKVVRFPAKQDMIAQAEGTLVIEVDQDYCWMWSSKHGSAPIAVKASLLRTDSSLR